MNKTSLHINLLEGSNANYFEALGKTFDTKVINDCFLYTMGNNRIKLTAYNILPEFEFLVVQSDYDQSIVIDRQANKKPDCFFINIVKQGKVIQNYNNEQQQMEADTPKGIFLYNGLFPLKSDFPAKHPLRSLAIKVSKNALMTMMPESIKIFDALFDHDEPRAYHTHISTEMDRILMDIFNHDDSEFGRKIMVTSKALELFNIFIQSLQSIANKDDFHGLHIDDYNRLMLIKEEIMKHVDTKLNIEELANKFAISVSKLQRDFKALFHSSVYQFYTHAKMDEAFRRLKTGQYSVMQVGYDLGYNSLSKFSQMFKKIKGINPKDVITLKLK
jgi:AraC-like DNA-binding protein